MDNLFEQDKNFLYGTNDNYNDTGTIEHWGCDFCCKEVPRINLIRLTESMLYICLDCIHNSPLKDFEDESENDREQIMKLRINYEVECQKAELKNQKARDERYWKEFTNVINFRKKIYSAISDMDKTDLILRKRFLNNYN